MWFRGSALSLRYLRSSRALTFDVRKTGGKLWVDRRRKKRKKKGTRIILPFNLNFESTSPTLMEQMELLWFTHFCLERNNRGVGSFQLSGRWIEKKKKKNKNDEIVEKIFTNFELDSKNWILLQTKSLHARISITSFQSFHFERLLIWKTSFRKPNKRINKIVKRRNLSTR